MFRAGVRLLGFLLLAAGFVGAVMDGARSLAASSLDYARIGETALLLLGDRFGQLQPAVERNLHPLVWNPVMTTLLMFPTALLLLGLGLICHRIGRPPPILIGHVTRN